MFYHQINQIGLGSADKENEIFSYLRDTDVNRDKRHETFHTWNLGGLFPFGNTDTSNNN